MGGLSLRKIAMLRSLAVIAAAVVLSIGTACAADLAPSYAPGYAPTPRTTPHTYQRTSHDPIATAEPRIAGGRARGGVRARRRGKDNPTC